MSKANAKERPILMSAPMVRAILEGRKTQTRRIVKGVPDTTTEIVCFGDEWLARDEDGVADATPSKRFRCPYGKPGDRLWVRETFRRSGFDATNGLMMLTTYKDGCERWAEVARREDMFLKPKWIPSIFMPRWASRITLEITEVRVQRLQAISEEDACAEGADPIAEEVIGQASLHYRAAFQSVWMAINGCGSWSANPWVWAVTYKVVTA